MSAFTLDVSGKIPDCQARWPLNSTSDAPMMHLSSSRCTCPDAAALVANVHRAQLSSAPPQTRMSSRIFTQPSIPFIILQATL